MVGNQEEERKSVYFSRQKNVKGGVLIFVVADIWNCYNMDMFTRNSRLYEYCKSLDFELMIIQAFNFQKTSMAWVEQYMHQPHGEDLNG